MSKPKKKAGNKRKNSRKSEQAYFVIRKIIWALTVILIVLLCYLGFRFGRAIFTNDGRTDRMSANEATLTVLEGDTPSSVGKKLEQLGIIDSSIVFSVQAKLYSCQMEPGVYVVNSGMSSKAIAKMIDVAYEKAHKDKDKAQVK